MSPWTPGPEVVFRSIESRKVLRNYQIRPFFFQFCIKDTDYYLAQIEREEAEYEEQKRLMKEREEEVEDLVFQSDIVEEIFL